MTEQNAIDRAAACIWGEMTDEFWSRATPEQQQRYRGIASAAFTAAGLREEYAIVDRSNAGNIAEGHEDADDAIEAMDLYSLDGWMAGSRLVSDWRNLEST